MRQLLLRHSFVPIGEGLFFISCEATGGEFSTALWKKGKVGNQICPCCEELV